jgi:gliding motility-associated-like protein
MSFAAYDIFSASSLGGPYTNVGSVLSSAQTTFTHIGANANMASVYYYVQTRCTGNIYTSSIDTLKTIHLTVINPLNGTAKLSWNALSTPSLSSTANSYKIYQEFPTGVWTLIGTKNNTNIVSYNYIDTILICNSNINYRIEISDNSGCTSVSSAAGGVFQNSIVPAVPVLDTLSINDNNIVTMSWYKSPSVDTKGYVIYKFNGVAIVVIDTVLGINNTSYTYPLSNPNINSEQYLIVAYDSCNNSSILSQLFSTMYLTSAPDICSRAAKLNWTAYSQQIGTGLASYLIYQSTASAAGPYMLAGTVNGGTLSYTAAGLAPKTTYYFKVTAIDSSGTKTASSNRITFYSATPKPPMYLYLRSASVVAPNQIDVTCHVDVTSSVSYYKVFRAIDNGTASPSYSQIGTIPASGITPVIFSDVNVKPDKYSYYYKIVIVDSCGYDGIETNVAHTMVLSASSKSIIMENYLRWTSYGDWLGGVYSYNIYRGVDGIMEPTLIGTVIADSSGVYTYTDNVSDIVNGTGIFNYYIQAVEGGGNIYGFTDVSLSNVVKAYQDPLVYIPNAFYPKGDFNKVFKPIVTYADNQEYEFSIFDKWGGLVFTTNNVNEGWDGTYKGSKCGIGVFVYLIQLKTSRGDYKTLKGSITLLD